MSVCTHRKHPAGRTLHVLDVENLAGGTEAARPLAEVFAQYRATMAVTADDHVLLGTGPTMALEASLSWPGAMLRVGRGIDGADRALLAEADPTFLAAHYDRVVIGSGDHAFAPLVSQLRALGVAVCVIARHGESLAGDLRRLTLSRTLPTR
jgi:hypothetical protein